MTQAELTKMIKEATQLTGAQADEFLKRLCDIIAAELLGGGEVTLLGIGKLQTVERAARKGRNPRTGKIIDIAASKAVKFSISKKLKESLN